MYEWSGREGEWESGRGYLYPVQGQKSFEQIMKEQIIVLHCTDEAQRGRNSAVCICISGLLVSWRVTETALSAVAHVLTYLMLQI